MKILSLNKARVNFQMHANYIHVGILPLKLFHKALKTTIISSLSLFPAHNQCSKCQLEIKQQAIKKRWQILASLNHYPMKIRQE